MAHHGLSAVRRLSLCVAFSRTLDVYAQRCKLSRFTVCSGTRKMKYVANLIDSPRHHLRDPPPSLTRPPNSSPRLTSMDHADYTVHTRHHELYHADQESICPEGSTSVDHQVRIDDFPTCETMYTRVFAIKIIQPIIPSNLKKAKFIRASL